MLGLSMIDGPYEPPGTAVRCNLSALADNLHFGDRFAACDSLEALIGAEWNDLPALAKLHGDILDAITTVVDAAHLAALTATLPTEKAVPA